LTAPASSAAAAPAHTNATYFNDASLPAADPHVLHDSAKQASGAYLSVFSDIWESTSS
jgi:hypothetical protein